MIRLNEEITKETRFDSWLQTPTGSREREILAVLKGRTMTVRQIADALGKSDRNAVAPRMTEMMHRGVVFVDHTVKDPITGRSVAAYRIVGE